MKTVVFSPAALDRLADIIAYSIERFGLAQADAYAARLADRLEALAASQGPEARPCERLMRGVRDASGLTCYREGVHYLILREKTDALEVVEIFHERMDLEAHLEHLIGDDTS
ncbi:MAG: type II toxin-antitoxin system RelE/ParE family toxin [Defluviicoccus sp.]|nr:type II toxin-antitoxin system RelE/ParE family toxin [Defluviicoccus sp.]MDE0172423.1 type II toxin-antitoxin system RelE/ParE family toxin [Defluviicoccus sp.]MDE0276546.1 type II toxin-antitoxin system RelE/ParE family toxin [Defluviicoccus sp.]MDE0276548.1 type II toxin-antitoxin system RelE/ParE family toxin [Defluviicoccus sp.]